MKKYLNKSRNYSGVYGKGLSNHLPMSTIALAILGGTESDLEENFAVSIRTLRPYSPLTSELTIDNWTEHLGKPQFEAAYFKYFLEQLKQLGSENCLKLHLPFLIKGSLGGAFHPLIQTWYGLGWGELPEVAAGLAHWAIAFRILPFDLGDSETSFVNVLDELSRSKELNQLNPKGFLIVDRAYKVASHPEYGNKVGNIAINVSEFEEFRLKMAKVFLGFQNFSLLHGITSSQALAGLLEFFPDKLEAVRQYMAGLLAIYVMIGCPTPKPKVDNSSDLSWDDICAEVIKSRDSHILKLVFTMKLEYENNPRREFIEIASMMAFRRFKFQNESSN